MGSVIKLLKTYAMILKNRIIDVVTSDTIPNYPPDVDGNIVTAVECDNNITVDDIYHPETGKCEHIEITIPEPEPTQLDRIEEKINLNYEQAQQSAVDAYTMELMEGGIL